MHTETQIMADGPTVSKQKKFSTSKLSKKNDLSKM